MTPHELIATLDDLADAPDGVKRLRELVLRLAVRGLLVPGRVHAHAEGPRLRWRQVRTGDVGEIKLGRQRSPDNHSGDHMVPYLRVANVHEARIDTSDVKSMNFTPGEQATFRLRWGDVLLNEGQSRELVGRPAIYRDNVPGACFQNTLLRFRPDPAILSPEFSLVVFRAYLHSGRFQAAAQQTTNIAHLSAKRLAAIEFPLPPLAEQHRIVARVDEMMGLLDRLEAAGSARDDARRAARDAALAALRDAEATEGIEGAWDRIARNMDTLLTDPADVQHLRVAVREMAVRGRLVPQSRSDEPAERLLGRILAEQVGNKRKNVPSIDRSDLGFVLPASWAVARLGHLTHRTDAGWSPKCDGHPTEGVDTWGVLKTTAVQANAFLDEHHKALPGTLEPRPELEVCPGDLLVTRAGPSFRVGVAAAVTRTRRRLMLSDKIIRCRFTTTRCDGSWLAMAINHGPGFAFLREKQTGMDAAQMNISQDRLLLTPIPVPPLNEQYRIVAKVDELMVLCDALEARLASARGLHDQFAAAAVHRFNDSESKLAAATASAGGARS